MLRALRWFSALAAVAIATSAANAQTGSITGSVNDVGGSPIAGAQVAASQSSGLSAGQSISSNEGTYRIANLPAGTYTLTVTRIGYRPARAEGVTVTAGASAIQAFDLEPTAAVMERTVITAGKVSQKETDAPASTSVVTQAEVNERASISPVDHVLALPGVDVIRGGLLQANVTARGFNNIFSGTLLTLTDNRFAFVPSLRVNVPYLNPTTNEDIQQIEVVLGPAAALYGPNSANGVMHIITRSPFDSPGTTLTVDVGNQSVFRGAVRHANALNTRFAYKASFDWFTGKDFDSPVDAAELTPRDTDLKKYGGELRLDFRPGRGTDIVATYGRAQAGRAVEPTGQGAAQVKDWVFNTYQLSARRSRLFAQVFMNQSDAGETFLLRNRSPAAPAGGAIVDKSSQLVGQLQHGYGFMQQKFDFIYGLDYQLTTPRTEGTINGRNEDDDEFSEFGGYLHGTAHVSPMLDLIAAARIDKHSRLDDPVWSPRAAVVFKPAESQAIRLTYNRAFSAPTTLNQSLDLIAGPGVRTLGTPTGGFQFREDCGGPIAAAGGLCMGSAFNGPGAALGPVNAAPFYQGALQVAISRGLQARLEAGGLPPATAAAVVARLREIDNPTANEVQTRIRLLNPSNSSFADLTDPAGFVSNLDAIEPTIVNAYEVGYKGFIGDRFALSVDLWHQKRENFVGPLSVETPSIFLDAATLAPYLADSLRTVFGTSPLGIATANAVAAQVAGGLGGINGGTVPAGTSGVPVGVITPDNPLTRNGDIILAYRNFGTVKYWGSDLGAQVLLTRTLSVLGTYSWVSDDYFDIGVQDIALNAPSEKGSATGRYRNEDRGLSAELRGRWVHGFPAVSGVYVGDACINPAAGRPPCVKNYGVLDAGVSYRLGPAMIAINGTNLLDKEHQQFPGGAVLGRFFMTRLQYTF